MNASDRIERYWVKDPDYSGHTTITNYISYKEYENGIPTGRTAEEYPSLSACSSGGIFVVTVPNSTKSATET